MSFSIHAHRTPSFKIGPRNTNPLGDIVASCIFDLDATLSDSFDSGVDAQKWKNVETTPADSEAQTAYDFDLGADSGASTDDPTHVGTIGAADAYFEHDGGDFFDLNGALTTALKTLHKSSSNQAFTLGIAFRAPATLATAHFFGTADGATNDPGLIFVLQPDGDIWFRTSDGSTRTGMIFMKNDGTFPLQPSTNYLMFMGADTANIGSSTVIAINSSTGAAWDNTDTIPTGSTDADACVLGANSAFGAPLPNQWRTYGFYLFNEVLNDTKLGLLKDRLTLRHQRNYNA